MSEQDTVPEALPETLGAPEWMTDAATQAVMAALEAKGGAGCARFVGGCVRNTLQGRPVDDVDIATVLTPDAVTEALAAAGLRAVPTGIEHGTVTALAEGRTFEITTLRRDVSTDGRRAVVAFTDDWAEDAQRRDFRFNAVYADGEGRLYDPTGEGVADALAGRVVFVGDAPERVREDYLRILRYFRFLAWYGGGAPDAAALAACATLRDLLQDRPGERVSKELLKLLAAPDPRPAVRLMVLTGVIDVILPFEAQLKRFEVMVEIDEDPLLRLAALIPEDPELSASVAERLRLSNAQRDRLVAAADAVYLMSPREARREIYRLGAGTFSDRVKLEMATSGSPRDIGWRTLLAEAADWEAPVFPLTGSDALEAGIAPGPAVGETLRKLEDWWIANDFEEDRIGLLVKLMKR